MHNLSHILQINLTDENLLDDPTSQQCIAQYYEQVEACTEQRIQCFRQQVNIDDSAVIATSMEQLQGYIGKREILLIRRESEFCGVLQVDSEIALAKALDLVEGDDFQLVSDYQADNGLLLALDEEWTEDGYEDMYTLTIWGEQWLRGFLS